MNKNVTLWFKVTDDLNERIERAAQALPGGKSALIRFAVERFVREVESGRVSTDLMLVDAPAEYVTE